MIKEINKPQGGLEGFEEDEWPLVGYKDPQERTHFNNDDPSLAWLHNKRKFPDKNKFGRDRSEGDINTQRLSAINQSIDNLKKNRDRMLGTQNAEQGLDGYWGQGIVPDEAYDENNPKYQHDLMLPSQFGRITVKAAPFHKSDSYDFPFYALTLFNIDRKDCKKIHSMFIGNKSANSVNQTNVDSRRAFNNDAIKFIIPMSKIEDWKANDLEEIINYLSTVQNENGESAYFKNEEEVNNLRQYVDSLLVSNFHEMAKDSISAHQSNFELLQLLSELENDSQVQEFMRLYQRVGYFFNKFGGAGFSDGGDVSKSFGHTITLQNMMIVMGSKKKTANGNSPTFILTQKQWARLGRAVRPNATRFVIYKPNNGSHINKIKPPKFTSDSYQKANTNGEVVDVNTAQDVAFNFFFAEEYKKLSLQQKISFNVMCNLVNNPSGFFPIIEYDIDDTVLIDPNNDPFNTEVGLKNRFNFEPNEAATELLKKVKALDDANDGEEEADGQITQTQDVRFDVMSENTKIAYKVALQYAKDNGIKAPAYSNDPSTSVILLLEEISKHLAVDCISHSKVDYLEPIINSTVHAYCFFNTIAMDVLNTVIPPNKRVQKNDEERINYVMVLLRKLDEEMNTVNRLYNDEEDTRQLAEGIDRNEDIGMLYLKTFAPELYKKKLTQRDSLMESFNKMLNRMEESKYNIKRNGTFI